MSFSVSCNKSPSSGQLCPTSIVPLRMYQHCAVENVPQMEFMYLAFSRMPGESQCRRLWSLLLCLCDIFQMLINSLVCWVIEMGPAGWVPDRDTALTLTQRHIDPQILNSKGLFMIVWMFTMHPRCLDVIRSVFILYFWGPWHQLQWIGPLRICWDNVLQ